MNLTRIRKSKNLTLKDLGDMIGMDAATIQRAEAMKDSAKLTTYIKCAKALGVTLEEIFADNRSALESELVKAFRELPDAQKEHALALLHLAKQGIQEKDV